MSRKTGIEFIAGGAIIIVISMILPYLPLGQHTLNEASEGCGSFLGRLGNSFSEDVRSDCQNIYLVDAVIKAVIIVGVIFVVVGVVVYATGKDEKFHMKQRKPMPKS